MIECYHVTGNNIDDVGASELSAALKDVPELSSLNLSCNDWNYDACFCSFVCLFDAEGIKWR